MNYNPRPWHQRKINHPKQCMYLPHQQEGLGIHGPHPQQCEHTTPILVGRHHQMFSEWICDACVKMHDNDMDQSQECVYA